MVTKKRK